MQPLPLVAIVPNFAAEARQKPRVSSVSLSIYPEIIDREIYIFLDAITDSIDRNPNFDALVYLVLKKKPFTIEKDPFFLLPSEFKRNTGFRNCRRNRPIMETDPSKDRACPNGNPVLRKGPFDNYRYPRLFILRCFFC